jgi:hypothetical protein
MPQVFVRGLCSCCVVINGAEECCMVRFHQVIFLWCDFASQFPSSNAILLGFCIVKKKNKKRVWQQLVCANNVCTTQKKKSSIPCFAFHSPSDFPRSSCLDSRSGSWARPRHCGRCPWSASLGRATSELGTGPTRRVLRLVRAAGCPAGATAARSCRSACTGGWKWCARAT